MTSLKAVARRFQKTIFKENGLPFFGTIMPVDEGEIPSTDFYLPRLLLRVTQTGLVKARDIILDDRDHRYIVGNHGYSPYGQHFTFRLFEVNADLAWKRVSKGKDPLTGLNRGNIPDHLGTIPCLVEMRGGEEKAGTVSEDIRRIITSAELQVGDQVDDATVRKIDTAIGVTYAEIV